MKTPPAQITEHDKINLELTWEIYSTAFFPYCLKAIYMLQKKEIIISYKHL